MEFYFDGYCPESLLKGLQIEMRLNEDDFWESEATGLQVTVFPPYAAILKWRGKGNFKQSSGFASAACAGLLLTKTQTANGKEFFPDEENIFSGIQDLEQYLAGIFDTKEQFDAAKLKVADPEIAEQEKHLISIAKEEIAMLGQLFEKVNTQLKEDRFISRPVFSELHNRLYNLGIIFNFDWMKWEEGRKNINDAAFDYSGCSLVELSMYLTAIFRADRFSEGIIEHKFSDGTLEKIFRQLSKKVISHTP